jgi:hypothetical protein
VACQLGPDSSSSSDNTSSSSIEKLSNAVIDAHLQGLHCIISDHPQLWTEPVPLTDGSVPGLSYISQASHSFCSLQYCVCSVIYWCLQFCEHGTAVIATVEIYAHSRACSTPIAVSMRSLHIERKCIAQKWLTCLAIEAVSSVHV